MTDLSQKNFEDLNRIASQLGAAVFGVASMENMSTEKLPDTARGLARFPYGVSMGIRLSDAIIDALVDGPTRQYAYHYRIINHQYGFVGKLVVYIARDDGAGCAFSKSIGHEIFAIKVGSGDSKKTVARLDASGVGAYAGECPFCIC